MSKIVEERTRRTQWFLQDRFGMFIHWGLYAIPARGEWIRSIERISNEDYEPFFHEFNPVHYDPGAWARAAKNAGMKYAVMTAKHHDGFCMFDSQLTDYKCTNTQSGRDFVREFLDAFRAEGLKVGLYYSLLDWHHPDYPAYGDQNHPMRDNTEWKGKDHRFGRYLEYMHGQIRELLTNYGKLDIMWFDFSYGDMTAETWKATELVTMVRELQPDIILDNRLDASGEYGGSIKTASPTVYSGDFASPEQIIPYNGVTDELGNSIPWEACVTLNNNWGYCANDRLYKTPKTVIRTLVECVSKNGNLLLNVGPNAKGEIPQESLDILEQVGRWMKENSGSIYGCGYSGLPKPDWGRYTRKGNLLYAHIFEQGIGPVCFDGLGGKVKKMRLLRDGSELKLETAWTTAQYPEAAFVSFGENGTYSYPLPDETDTVVEIELK